MGTQDPTTSIQTQGGYQNIRSRKLNQTTNILANDVLPADASQSLFAPDMTPAPLPSAPQAANNVFKKGGKVKLFCRGGGIEIKGKTKGVFR